MVNTLDHLPLLPLFVCFNSWPYVARAVLKQDELRIYHALRLHGRIRHIGLDLPPSILHKALALMDGNFPILEHLSLSSPFSPDSRHHLPLTLPKDFVAPNLLHLTLSGIGLPKRLRVLTSTVSLVRLTLSNIQTSSYFRPRLLVARLRSLPLLEGLTIGFSIPIPRPSTERESLGENRAPVTLPSLKSLSFNGVGAYLESLVTQIRVPLLEYLYINLSHQTTVVLPHLFDLINTTKVFKRSSASVDFLHKAVCVTTERVSDSGWITYPLYVHCNSSDWQIDSAARICHALIPTLSGVEELALDNLYHDIPTEMRNGAIDLAIDSTTWHDLLRTFIGVKKLSIGSALSEELSRALQVDEVGLDPGFLPNLQCIRAKEDVFTSFIDTRQVVGRPVQFEEYQQ